MRNILAGLCFLSLLSCGKHVVTEGPIVEPPFPYEVLKDTIVQGGLWDLMIGTDKHQIYSGIQSQQHIAYLGITGVIPNDLSEIEHTIGLYNAVLIDETRGTPTGLQFYFKDDKVKSIYTNSGHKVLQWPVPNAVSVKLGDPVAEVYRKFKEIKKQAAHANKFERISLFSKNITKSFDSRNMTISDRWEISSGIGGPKILTTATLVFTNGKLDSIYQRVEKYH